MPDCRRDLRLYRRASKRRPGARTHSADRAVGHDLGLLAPAHPNSAGGKAGSGHAHRACSDFSALPRQGCGDEFGRAWNGWTGAPCRHRYPSQPRGDCISIRQVPVKLSAFAGEPQAATRDMENFKRPGAATAEFNGFGQMRFGSRQPRIYLKAAQRFIPGSHVVETDQSGRTVEAHPNTSPGSNEISVLSMKLETRKT